jgi:hypothetical protein
MPMPSAIENRRSSSSRSPLGRKSPSVTSNSRVPLDEEHALRTARSARGIDITIGIETSLGDANHLSGERRSGGATVMASRPRLLRNSFDGHLAGQRPRPGTAWRRWVDIHPVGALEADQTSLPRSRQAFGIYAPLLGRLPSFPASRRPEIRNPGQFRSSPRSNRRHTRSRYP